MKDPSAIDEGQWSFQEIHAVDDKRAERLEMSGSPQALVAGLSDALGRAIRDGNFRVGVDSKSNKFIDLRYIVQFRVSPALYDWFFSARTGYRAQFWISPEHGTNFNEQTAGTLGQVLKHALPNAIAARRIEVYVQGQSREERDTGQIIISRHDLIRSLQPAMTKIWICERLYSGDGDSMADIGFKLLLHAEQSTAKLRVPRWAVVKHLQTGELGEGLRAPFPSLDSSWLDMKGGFSGFDGSVTQIKSQKQRAQQIHNYGWT